MLPDDSISKIYCPFYVSQVLEDFLVFIVVMFAYPFVIQLPIEPRSSTKMWCFNTAQYRHQGSRILQD